MPAGSDGRSGDNLIKRNGVWYGNWRSGYRFDAGAKAGTRCAAMRA